MKMEWDNYVQMVRATCAPKRRTWRQWWEENKDTVELWLILAGVAVFICGLAVCSSLYPRGGVN